MSWFWSWTELGKLGMYCEHKAVLQWMSYGSKALVQSLRPLYQITLLVTLIDPFQQEP